MALGLREPRPGVVRWKRRGSGLQAAAETEEDRAGPCSELQAGEAPGASWSWHRGRRGGGRRAGRGGPRGLRAGSKVRWAGVRRADLMLGKKRRERESPGLGKEQPVAMAMRLGT